MKKEKIKYSTTTIFLHWLSAIVILWALLTGGLISLVELDVSVKHQIATFNVSLTTLFVPFFVWRIINRLATEHPKLLLTTVWQMRLAGYVHTLLYIFTSIVLLSGLFMMEEAINVFGVFLIPRIINVQDVNLWFSHVHLFSSISLAFLVFIHIAAVFNHKMKGVNLLSRMR
ncbi:cytochrome b [Thalassotalea ganghwensis]